MFDSSCDIVVLDRVTFRALSVDTRIRILKELNERRKTLSEISRSLDMSVSAVKEHLEVLSGSGLVYMNDEGHKWKYYELTEKGMCVLEPRRRSISVVLGLFGVALVSSVLGFASRINFDMLSSGGVYNSVSLSDESAMVTKDSIGIATDAVPQTAVEHGPNFLSFFSDGKFPFFEFLSIVALLVAILVFIRSVRAYRPFKRQ